MSSSPALLLFRKDLRLADHAPLRESAREAAAVIPVFILDESDPLGPALGAASRWWLHHSLARLDEQLRRRGLRLILRRGETGAELNRLARETGAREVYLHEAPHLESSGGLRWRGYPSGDLHVPEMLLNRQRRPYRVFTPFWKSLRANPRPGYLGTAPRKLPAPGRWPDSLDLDELDLLPAQDWTAGLAAAWRPGEAEARKALRRFLREGLESYGEQREYPGRKGSSRLSPALHFGELSPWRLWREASDLPGAEPWLRQLGWREFARHILRHFPETRQRPMNRRFQNFPWRRDVRALQAWQGGRTGYPLVDAGMRELWSTGWMHNRVRMVAASFLTKQLLIPWTEGQRWFEDTLVDADRANNSMGWQWVAGSGADAAPYFRIFNPVAQSRRFDARGEYLRRWLPELAALPERWIHAPWEAPASVLQESGLELGRDYPRPIVEHAAARDRALKAYASLRGEEPE